MGRVSSEVRQAYNALVAAQLNGEECFLVPDNLNSITPPERQAEIRALVETARAAGVNDRAISFAAAGFSLK